MVNRPVIWMFGAKMLWGLLCGYGLNPIWRLICKLIIIWVHNCGSKSSPASKQDPNLRSL